MRVGGDDGVGPRGQVGHGAVEGDIRIVSVVLFLRQGRGLFRRRHACKKEIDITQYVLDSFLLYLNWALDVMGLGLKIKMLIKLQ